MKKIFAFALFICSISTNAQTPTWAWARMAGSETADEANGIACDNWGNTYVTGSFSWDSMLVANDTLYNQSIYGTDFYVFKYDSTGNLIWAKSWGSDDYEQAYDITTDSSGNVYIIGQFSSPFLVLGLDTLFNPGTSQMFLMKCNSAGNPMWATSSMGNSGSSGASVKMAKNGNVVISGTFGAPTDILGIDTLFSNGAVDFFLAELDSSGDYIWAKSYGSYANEMPNDLSVDMNGNICLAGYYGSDTLIIGTDTLINSDPSSYDILVAKFDSSGNPLWARGAGGIAQDAANGIATDNQGKIAVAGKFANTITFDTISLSGIYDMYVVVYDSSGNAIWADAQGSAAGSDGGNTVRFEPNGDLILGGYFSDQMIFGSITISSQWSSYYTDCFVAKYSNSGTALWGIKASCPDYDAVGVIDINQFGQIMVAGGGHIGMQFGTIGVPGFFSDDIFVARLDTPILTGFFNTDLFSKGSEIILYPNPVNNFIQLGYNTDKNGGLVCSLLNLLGEKMLEQNFTAHTGANHFSIPISQLPKGIYFLKMENGNETTTRMVVVE